MGTRIVCESPLSRERVGHAPTPFVVLARDGRVCKLACQSESIEKSDAGHIPDIAIAKIGISVYISLK